MTYFASTPLNISTISTGTVVADRLLLVTVNTGAAGAIFKIYDGTAAVAAKIIATIDASSPGTFTYMVRPPTHNLFYALSVAAADVTIIYD